MPNCFTVAARRTAAELHKPILSMFINCSYMSESKLFRPGPIQPTVDQAAPDRRNFQILGEFVQKSSFCAFLRFLAFLRLSASFCAFCNFVIHGAVRPACSVQFGSICTILPTTIRTAWCDQPQIIQYGAIRLTTNNSIRRDAICHKLLHTKSDKICSNRTKLH